MNPDPITPAGPASVEAEDIVIDEFIAGGPDPDFVLRPAGMPRRPLICAVPVIGGMLPQCR